MPQPLSNDPEQLAESLKKYAEVNLSLVTYLVRRVHTLVLVCFGLVLFDILLLSFLTYNHYL